MTFKTIKTERLIDGDKIDNLPNDTTAELALKVDKTTTVNGKTLSSNVTLTTDDVSEGTTNLYDKVVSILASTGIQVTGTYPNFTIENTDPGQLVSLTNGTGITISGTYPNFTITNSAPDQTVSLTAGTNVTITGTYPNFTINSTASGTGDVTASGTLTDDTIIVGGGTKVVKSSSKTITTSLGSDNTTLPTSKAVKDVTDTKLTKNVAIAGATKTKITYDSNGLVTSGADATTADIADSLNKRYVTDANLTVIGNTSGTNTGDETTSSIKTKLGITTLSGSNTGDETTATIKTKLGVASTSTDGYLTSTDWNTFNGKQAQLNGTGFVKAIGTTISYDNSTYLTTVTESDITLSDVTTNNASATKHGFLPKLDNTGTKYLRDDGTWQTVAGGLSWGSSITGTSGTGLTTTVGANASAGTIGQSIVIGNTQTNAVTGLKVTLNASGTGNNGILLDTAFVDNTLIGLNISGSGGIGTGIKNTGNQFGIVSNLSIYNFVCNNFGTATQAILNNYGFIGGQYFNTNSIYHYTGIELFNENNTGTGVNSGIIIRNYSTDFNLSIETGRPHGTGMTILQNGVGGTAFAIATDGDINSSTNGLANITLHNTQSGASTLLKLDTGTSARAHKGILIKAYGASTTQTGLEIDLSTSGTGSHLRLLKGTSAGTPITEGDLVYNGTNLYFKPSGTAVDLLAGGGLSWGASITGTSGTGITTTIGNSASAGTIGQSIVIGNTQTNALTMLNLDFGTSSVSGHAGIKINPNKFYHYAFNITHTGGRVFEINSDSTENDSRVFNIDFLPNNASTSGNIMFVAAIRPNASTGNSTGFKITSTLTAVDIPNLQNSAFILNQTGVGGTPLLVKGGDNVNSSTNGLVNYTLSNTQSGATVMQKIDLGTSPQDHTGLLINQFNNSTSSFGININQSTTGSGFAFRAISSGASNGFVRFGSFRNANPESAELMYLTVANTSSTLAGKANDYSIISNSRTSTRTSGTTADNYNNLYISRTSIQNGAGGTFTSAGSVLKLENVATQTAGTLTDTVSVLTLKQGITTTGSLITMESGNTNSAAIDFATNLTTATAPTGTTTNYINIKINGVAYRLEAKSVA